MLNKSTRDSLPPDFLSDLGLSSYRATFEQHLARLANTRVRLSDAEFMLMLANMLNHWHDYQSLNMSNEHRHFFTLLRDFFGLKLKLGANNDKS